MQIVALSSHRWFVSDVGLYHLERQVGLRDSQWCDFYDQCVERGVESIPHLANIVFYGGWLCALALIAALVAHRWHGFEKLWRPAGALSLALVPLTAMMLWRTPAPDASPGAAFLVAFLGLGLGALAGLRRQWADAEPIDAPLPPREALPPARVRVRRERP